MKKITFGLVGTGWRADFYRRIAQLVPDRFVLAAVYTRTPERAAELSAASSVPITADWHAFVATPLDFVVLSVKRGEFVPYLKKLHDVGIPALCETPPAETLDELNALWAWAKPNRARIQVAEQYFLQPLYAAWLEAVRLGLLGEVSNVNLSALHGYHAASVFRKVLGVGDSAFRVTGQSFHFPVVSTRSRAGADTSGTVTEATRVRATVVFDNNKTAFFDFSSVQYYSSIRTRQLTIQGTRGEIDDLSIRYLKPDNTPVFQTLDRVDLGVYNNQHWSHEALRLGERTLYQSPLPGARLNDDELAIASCLLGMAEFVDTGRDFYSLHEALQDTYLALALDEAVAQPGQTIVSRPQGWHAGP